MTQNQETAENTAASAIRKVEFGFSVCTVCDQDVEWKWSAQKMGQPTPIRVHGPRDDRCPGGLRPGKTFLEYTGLPDWDGMSDLDKGCALMFVWKVEWERSWRYAKDNYPCRYRDTAVLSGLDVDDSCRHAQAVTGGHRKISRKLGDTEHDRLYGLVLAADRAAS